MRMFVGKHDWFTACFCFKLSFMGSSIFSNFRKYRHVIQLGSHYLRSGVSVLSATNQGREIILFNLFSPGGFWWRG